MQLLMSDSDTAIACDKYDSIHTNPNILNVLYVDGHVSAVKDQDYEDVGCDTTSATGGGE